ncbi:MAG TPA: PAS domain-containing protein, partial [Usitatibacter sp.]
MNEDFKRIVEALRTALATADAKGTITFANEAFARLVGRDNAALVDSSLPALFIEADRKRIQQNIARVGDGKA